MESNSKKFKDNYKYNAKKILEIIDKNSAKDNKIDIVGEKESGRKQ